MFVIYCRGDGRVILTKTEEFPHCDKDYQDVYVTAVTSPDLLYVQLASKENEQVFFCDCFSSYFEVHLSLPFLVVITHPSRGLLHESHGSDLCKGGEWINAFNMFSIELQLHQSI